MALARRVESLAYDAGRIVYFPKGDLTKGKHRVAQSAKAVGRSAGSTSSIATCSMPFKTMMQLHSGISSASAVDDFDRRVRGCEQRFFSVEGAFLQLTLRNFKQQCCHGDVPELSIVLPREPT